MDNLGLYLGVGLMTLGAAVFLCILAHALGNKSGYLRGWDDGHGVGLSEAQADHQAITQAADAVRELQLTTAYGRGLTDARIGIERDLAITDRAAYERGKIDAQQPRDAKGHFVKKSTEDRCFPQSQAGVQSL